MKHKCVFFSSCSVLTYVVILPSFPKPKPNQKNSKRCTHPGQCPSAIPHWQPCPPTNFQTQTPRIFPPWSKQNRKKKPKKKQHPPPCKPSVGLRLAPPGYPLPPTPPLRASTAHPDPTRRSRTDGTKYRESAQATSRQPIARPPCPIERIGSP